MTKRQDTGSKPGEAERHLTNFGGNMKFRISLILLVMALAASSAVSAHDRGCTNSIIKGDYAFTIHGQILTPNGPLLVDGVAKTTFDGDGNLTQVDAVAINGNIPLIWRPSTGTYTVNSDCTGTMTLISTGQPTLHLAILVSQSGNHIHTVVTDPGFATTSDAERVWAHEDLD
jgi:hypothetical protein